MAAGECVSAAKCVSDIGLRPLLPERTQALRKLRTWVAGKARAVPFSRTHDPKIYPAYARENRPNGCRGTRFSCRVFLEPVIRHPCHQNLARICPQGTSQMAAGE